MSEKQKLMRTIQSLGFTLTDTNLYLDAYDSDEAFEYFKSVKEIYANAVKEYEKKYGPLTAHATAMYDTWLWTETPWPWEMEANC